MLGGLPEKLFVLCEKVLPAVFLITDAVDLVSLNIFLFYQLFQLHLERTETSRSLTTEFVQGVP